MCVFSYKLSTLILGNNSVFFSEFTPFISDILSLFFGYYLFPQHTDMDEVKPCSMLTKKDILPPSVGALLFFCFFYNNGPNTPLKYLHSMSPFSICKLVHSSMFWYKSGECSSTALYLDCQIFSSQSDLSMDRRILHGISV